jgi:hypothetical protein
MFHVKHFCPIGAKNLTRPPTACRRQTCGIVQNIGRVGGCMARARRRTMKWSRAGRETSDNEIILLNQEFVGRAEHCDMVHIQLRLEDR